MNLQVPSCTCASFFTVRGVHKRDCSYYQHLLDEEWRKKFPDPTPTWQDEFDWKFDHHGWMIEGGAREAIKAFITTQIRRACASGREDEAIDHTNEYLKAYDDCNERQHVSLIEEGRLNERDRILAALPEPRGLRGMARFQGISS